MFLYALIAAKYSAEFSSFFLVRYFAPFKNSENKGVCNVQRKRANIKIAWAVMIEIKFSMWVVARNRSSLASPARRVSLSPAEYWA